MKWIKLAAMTAGLRIAFAASASAPVGTTYTIGVDETFTSFATPGADSSLVDYTSLPGTVTVTPEPGALVLPVVLGALAFMRRRVTC